MGGERPAGLSYAGGADVPGTGRSELKMSAIAFQPPSACFFQTTTYLPRSVIALPCASFSVMLYVPNEYAMSALLATSILIGVQEMPKPGIAVIPVHAVRMAGFPIAIG